MISVVIPTLNAAASLPGCFSSLLQATMRGLVREVIVADGGSTDDTVDIADAAGATVLRASPGRGTQLAAGADAARADWLLFLHADTHLEPGWEAEAITFIEQSSIDRPSAAFFKFALDDRSAQARLLEKLVAMRCMFFALPYGDQGLLVPARLYRKLGGFKPIALMEDVDLVRRLGRGRLATLRARAITSAVRYRADGYWRRSARNVGVLTLYALRVPTPVLVRLYG